MLYGSLILSKLLSLLIFLIIWLFLSFKKSASLIVKILSWWERSSFLLGYIEVKLFYWRLVLNKTFFLLVCVYIWYLLIFLVKFMSIFLAILMFNTIRFFITIKIFMTIRIFNILKLLHFIFLYLLFIFLFLHFIFLYLHLTFFILHLIDNQFLSLWFLFRC